jgi:hypothetical protein
MRGPIEDVDHVLLAAGTRNQVWDMGKLAAQIPHDIAKCLAARVRCPIDGVSRAQSGQRPRRGDLGRRYPERRRVRRLMIGQVMAWQQCRHP